MPENAEPNQKVTPPASVPAPGQQAPVSPEMEAVSANRPVAAKPAALAKPAVAAPKKIGKEKLEKSKRQFILGCAGGLLFLFVLFIVLMVLMISRSGASNPVMQAFGLNPAGVRSFLQGVIGFTFGLLSLLFLVLTVISLFRFFGAQKSDKEKRGHNLRLMILDTVLLVVMIFIWVGLANFIGRIEIAAEQVVAEIVVTNPKDITNLVAPVEITFSAMNVAKGLEGQGVKIESMNWDLEGDGSFSTPVTTPEVTHLYTRKGTYNVGLEVKVKGEDKFREPYIKTIDIPNATFAADPSSGVAPLDVQFDASQIVTKTDVSSLDWDFENDGTYDLTGPDNLNPKHTFTQIGTYKVHLRAIGKNNNVDNYYKDIEVTAATQPIVNGVIDATPGLKGTVPFQVRFDASRSTALKGKLASYQWDFGDGSDLQTGMSVSHVYQKAGSYTVVLHLADQLGNKADANADVAVQEVANPPEAVISTTPVPEAKKPLTGTLPFKVDFDASGSTATGTNNNIVQYEWDFNGDGTVDQEGKKLTNTFDKAGTYNVQLTVTDSNGQKGTATLEVDVTEPGVQAVITATPEEGTVPLIVQFDGSSSSAYQGNIVSYEWDFGDGSPKTITSAIVSHKYTAVGSYDVKLKVLTNTNATAATTKQIFVREVPLKACFTPSRSSGMAPLTVAFDTKCSTGAVNSYQWQFGDGAESTSKSPSHTFDNPGNYTVTLEISDSKSNVSDNQQVIAVEGELK